MPRHIQEIVNEIKNAKYTSASGPLLDLCRELAADGKFEELADSVSIWLSKFPQSNEFVRARMPAVVLNSYLVKLEILGFSDFLKWEEDSDWADKIRSEADNPLTLPSVVEAVVNSMRTFKPGIA